VIDVDLTGVFFGAQAAGKSTIEAGTGGAVLNISSIMGELGLHKRAPYCSAKAGVNNLTRTNSLRSLTSRFGTNHSCP
jgi:3-oxoacyl-[acyl-carrier protein] reductase